jgi:hypothetical protein
MSTEVKAWIVIVVGLSAEIAIATMDWWWPE